MPPVTRLFPAPWAHSHSQTRWRSEMRRKAFVYCVVSPSPSGSSGMAGDEITYFSLAQLPRSMILQRSEQKGKNGSSAETSFLQIGHFIVLRRVSEKHWPRPLARDLRTPRPMRRSNRNRALRLFAGGGSRHAVAQRPQNRSHSRSRRSREPASTCAPATANRYRPTDLRSKHPLRGRSSCDCAPL